MPVKLSWAQAPIPNPSCRSNQAGHRPLYLVLHVGQTKLGIGHYIQSFMSVQPSQTQANIPSLSCRSNQARHGLCTQSFMSVKPSQTQATIPNSSCRSNQARHRPLYLILHVGQTKLDRSNLAGQRSLHLVLHVGQKKSWAQAHPVMQNTFMLVNLSADIYPAMPNWASRPMHIPYNEPKLHQHIYNNIYCNILITSKPKITVFK